MLRVIIIICVYFMFTCVHAQNSFSPKPEILLHTIEAATDFPAFNRFIEDQGVTILQQELLKKIPYTNVKTNGDARYFGIGRVSLYDYSYVESQDNLPQKAFLAKVLFTLFVYDVENQQTILKQDFPGYKAFPYSEDSKIALLVLKKAFQEAISSATNHVDIPLRGKVIAVNSESITVDIGTFHSISANNKLDVVDKSGQSLGFAEVLSSELKREQCKAYFAAMSSGVIVGDGVRLVIYSSQNEKTEKQWEQEAVDEALQRRNVSFTKLNTSPNPPLKLEIGISTDSNIVYIDKRSRTLSLQVYGFDAWEDEIIVKDNIVWKPGDWEINTTSQNEFVFIANKFGSLELYAIYTNSVTNSTIKSPFIPLEIRQLEDLKIATPYLIMAPNEEEKLDLKAIYNNGKILATEQVYSELIWEYDHQKLQINNGLVKAGNIIGDASIKIYSKSLPQIATYFHILVLPSLQLQITSSENAIPNNSIIQLNHNEKISLQWNVKGIPNTCNKYIETKWDISPPGWGKTNYDGNNLFFVAGSKVTTTPIKIIATVQHVASKSKRKDISTIIWLEIREPLFTAKFILISICVFVAFAILFTISFKWVKAIRPLPIPRKFNSCYLQVIENKQEHYIYLVSKKSVVLGRSSNCDVQVYHTNTQGKPNKELTNFISRKHCQLTLENNNIWLEKIAQTEKHNVTIVNEINKLDTEIKYRLEDKDILKIGRLNIKINIWRDPKNKQIQCMRLQYLNNPYHKEEYVIIYTNAKFGSGVNVPIRIRENIPDIAGEFVAQQNHIFVQKNSQGKWIPEQQRPLIANTSFIIGKSKFSVHLDED